jgi:hypothetical protein
VTVACTTRAGALVSAAAPPGTFTPVWAHLQPAADGHEPGVPPVTVTYCRAGDSWDAECAEVPGFPVRAVASLDEAKAAAWMLLGKIMPPRPVIERKRFRAPGA